MNRRAFPLAAAVLAFIVAEGLAPADLAPPQRPRPSASAASFAAAVETASATASARAAPVVAAVNAAPAVSSSAAAAAAEAPGKSFQEEPPGPEKSGAPSAEAWREAKVIPLDRNVAACRAYRVREWLKVHCDGFPAAGVSLLAGDPEGVLTWVDPVTEGTSQEAMKKPRGAEVIFPVRRGDGRVVQLAQFGEGYDGPLGWNVGFTVSEQWLAGEPSPIVTVW